MNHSSPRLSRTRRRPRFRVLIWTLVVAIGVVIGTISGILLALSHDLPPIRMLETYQPSAITRMYSADGILLGEFYGEQRDPVALVEVPRMLIDALLATEDRNFFDHGGVDFKGVVRAILHNLSAGRYVQGASTLTQQLTKTLFLTPRKTLTRKLEEAILAFQLERRYTKDEILALYLNQVYFGSGAYGVAAAAQRFYGKSLPELTLAECALIAGMPKAPSRYSPLVDSQRAILRRNIVLRQMKALGWIDTKDYETAVAEAYQPLGLVATGPKAPYFVDYVKKIMEDALGPAALYRGGLTIRSTLVFGLQQAAEQAVEQTMSDFDRRRTPTQKVAPSAQCALVALDVADGRILALVGGRVHATSQFNRAVDARRQPGSAFKPLVYALAIERGFPQTYGMVDAPYHLKGAWHPENYSRRYLGLISLRRALAVSQNIPAVKLTEILGPADVVRFAHHLGIESFLSSNLSLALGTSEVTLLELTAAYAVFANQGNRTLPFGVLQVENSQGRIIWQHYPRKTAAMSRAGAAVMVNMLEAVVSEGTGRAAQDIPVSIAGKTGTTNGYRDALFVGFSPTIGAGVWVGYDDNRSLGDGETGSKAALPVWKTFMQAALKTQPLAYFDIPDDVVRIAISPTTGVPIESDGEPSVWALFKEDARPSSLTP